MKTIITLILLYLFYRMIFRWLFGQRGSGKMSGLIQEVFSGILSIIKGLVKAIFRLIQWSLEQIGLLILWVFKTSGKLLRGLFRFLIYDPNR